MTFEYWCDHCNLVTEEWAAIGEAPISVKCVQCGGVAERQYTAPMIIGAAVQDAEYNPAFGQVVKSKRHREELAKQRGMIEVGSERVDSLIKHQDDHVKRIANKDYED